MPIVEQPRHLALARELIALATLPDAERQIAARLRVYGAREVQAWDVVARADAYVECAEIATEQGAPGVAAAIRAALPPGVIVRERRGGT